MTLLSIMLKTKCFSLNLEEICKDKKSFKRIVCPVLCRLGHLERHLPIFVFFYGLHLDLEQLALFKLFYFKSPAPEIPAFCIFRCWGQSKCKSDGIFCLFKQFFLTLAGYNKMSTGKVAAFHLNPLGSEAQSIDTSMFLGG